eukprot:7047796-Prymnesium_polylepis.2
MLLILELILPRVRARWEPRVARRRPLGARTQLDGRRVYRAAACQAPACERCAAPLPPCQPWPALQRLPWTTAAQDRMLSTDCRPSP